MKKYLLIPALLLSTYVNAADNSMNNAKAGEIVWNELATNNVAAAKEFYGKMFGWEFTESKTGGMVYTMIKKNNKEFGGIWAIPENMQKQIPPHWIAYILVDNLEQALEKARQNGATIIKPAQKVDEMGTFGIIQDPTGAHIALWQSLKK